jgi:prolipoprotein diacylglyceryltransferase
MTPIKKNVLLRELLKLGFLIILVSSIFTRRINPILAGRVLGTAGLLYGAYSFYRALYQKDHSNLLLRLRGDERRIPYTKWHRVINMILAAAMIVCGVALLLVARSS